MVSCIHGCFTSGGNSPHHDPLNSALDEPQSSSGHFKEKATPLFLAPNRTTIPPFRILVTVPTEPAKIPVFIFLAGRKETKRVLRAVRWKCSVLDGALSCFVIRVLPSAYPSSLRTVHKPFRCDLYWKSQDCTELLRDPAFRDGSQEPGTRYWRLGSCHLRLAVELAVVRTYLLSFKEM